MITFVTYHKAFMRFINVTDRKRGKKGGRVAALKRHPSTKTVRLVTLFLLNMFCVNNNCFNTLILVTNTV